MTKNPLLDQILQRNTPAKPPTGQKPVSTEGYQPRAVGYAEALRRASENHVVPVGGQY